jgi:pseudouridine synthase
MRLTDFLARAGYGGRREASRLIAGGRVKVNGQVATQVSLEIEPARDHVRVDDKHVKKLWPLTYILLNKPAKTITTTFDPGGRRTVYELLGKFAKVVQSVGRLDYDTEGVLLLTNDGDLAHALTSPDSKVTKVYQVKVKGRPTPAELDRLRRGVDIGGYVTAPAQVKATPAGPANTWLRIALTEGKHRQVKRMADAIGRPALKLIRERFGPLGVGDLAPVQWRHLRDDEVRALRGQIDR